MATEHFLGFRKLPSNWSPPGTALANESGRKQKKSGSALGAEALAVPKLRAREGNIR